MKAPALPLSRRHFLAAAGATAIAAKIPTIAQTTRHTPNLVFAAARDKLLVYRTQGAAWKLVETLPSEAPISLITDASTQTLHILHSVREHRGLPCGYIQSLRIDKERGLLTPLSSQPLSLSATHPSHMALSPDGKTLAVAIHGGSAYNLLPILPSGHIGRPMAIRKETGFNSKSPSQPGHVAFHSNGDSIFALDQGKATLSVLSAQPGLPVLSRLSLSGSLTHLALHADADLLFTVDQASNSLLTIRYCVKTAGLSLQSRTHADKLCGPLAVDAATHTLYAATPHAIHLYRIEPVSGELQPLQTVRCPQTANAASNLILNSSSGALYLVTGERIFRSDIDSGDGTLSAFAPIAQAAKTIAFLT